MHLWTEFKNTILPWLLAAGVVAFLIAEHRRTTDALLGANPQAAPISLSDIRPLACARTSSTVIPMSTD